LGAVVLYPNTDPGYEGDIQAITNAARRDPGVRVFPSLPREVYLRLLRRAEVLVGNSSSGLIESAYLGTPSVNVGPRQEGRLRAAPCVLNAADNQDAVRRAIRKARRLHPQPGAWTAYGDGRAGRRIARKLATIGLTRRLAHKKITY
jgi:UDP-N-acetylglucosamine 2-epimerase (non-hydrolysing)/GDP/UDP-N,N'-diacetylbacillosamine 2-epimerase (hydrolysing)